MHRGGNGWVKPGKEDLRPYLARRHKKRAKKGMRKGERIFRPKGIPIDDRPSVVDTRSRIGDWEGDSVDNGPENQEWRETQEATRARVYFAHPYHSWERGTNENTNGLVRRYFPKGTDFREVSDEEIAKVEYALNTRPRKRHGFKSPLEIWSGSLQC